MTADQKIYAQGGLLTRGQIEACIITLSGRPRRIPLEMRQILEPLVVETET